jgi:hypothetical protein
MGGGTRQRRLLHSSWLILTPMLPGGEYADGKMTDLAELTTTVGWCMQRKRWAFEMRLQAAVLQEHRKGEGR